MSRERDIRTAIQNALAATQAFDGVHVFGLPEDCGSSADELAMAVIMPRSTQEDDLWDAGPAGGVIYRCTMALTVLARNEDPQARDEAAERLLNIAMNAINGQDLVPGLTIPDKTIVASWDWQKEEHPERRINCTISVWYEVEGWDAQDTTP